MFLSTIIRERQECYAAKACRPKTKLCLGGTVKYFTSEWWQNGSENATEIFKQYSAYFSSIKSKLPTSLVS
ncbi:MAG: hypothetical protein ACXWIN_02420, partial [Burkholderiaceae bacterium]